MADQRELFIFAEFDGDTEATSAMAWVPATGSGGTNPAGQRYRSLDTVAAIGRFPPDILGRGRTHSLVRVWADDPQLGDVAQIVSSASSAAANPTKEPRGAAVPIASGPQTAPILELDMTDELTITTDGRLGVHIEVLDLDEQQHLAWLVAKWATDNQPGSTSNIETRSIAAPAAIAPWVSILYAEATAGSPGAVVTLPALADVPLGARLFLWRSGANFFEVAPDAGDQINDQTGNVVFAAVNSGAIFEKTALGWTSTAIPNGYASVTATNSAALAVPTKLHTRVIWNMALEATLELPLLASTPVGATFYITVGNITGGFGGGIQAQGADTLNGQTAASGRGRIPLTRQGDAVLVVRVSDGYVAVPSVTDLDRLAEVVTADPGIGASVFRGVRTYICDYGANGDFTLPTAPLDGAEVVLVRLSANTVTAQAGANSIVAGAAPAASAALTQYRTYRFKFFRTAGGTNYWLGV